VSYFIFSGIVEPEIHVGYGTGDNSVLGERNVKELKLAANLKKVGVKRESIRNILKLLSESQLRWWEQEDSYVVIHKDGWFITDNAFSKSNREILFDRAGIIVKL